MMQAIATDDVIILGGSSKGTRGSGYLATFFLNLWGNAADLRSGQSTVIIGAGGVGQGDGSPNGWGVDVFVF